MIPVIAAPLSVEEFHERYWKPRQPVVVQGSAAAWLGRHENWLPTHLYERMRQHRAGVQQNLFWYDTLPGVLLDKADLPAFVERHVYGDDHLTRQHNVRLFAHPEGHVTSMHYEGNLFDVFSFQLRGKKRWRLMAGDRAHQLFPFYFLENQASYGGLVEDRDWTYTFELQPGELLFLPRGWYHHVECLTDDNVAISLVSAPKDPADLDCLTLKTYREQLALQLHLKGLLPRRFGEKVETFITNEDNGGVWARHFTRGLRRRDLLRRLVTDLALVTPAMAASMLLDGRSLAYLGYLDGLKARMQRNLE